MRRTPFVVSFALLVAACGSGSESTPAEPTSSNTSAATIGATTTTSTTTTASVVARRGTYAVGERRETYVDTSRPTDPNGDFTGAPERTLETVIWYPASGTATIEDEVAESTPDASLDTENGPYPLIIMSHGWTANPAVYQTLGHTWASAGYVVAAPAYPLSNTNAPGGPIIGDVKNQPADASFVIAQVLADTALSPVIDIEHIGAAGHSLGAITTFGLAFSQCCSDDRIDAAIPMSGIAGLVDGGANYFRSAAVPVLIFHGTDDTTVPYGSSVDAYAKAKAPKAFVTFAKGDHIWPYIGGGADARRVAFQDMTTAWFDRWLKNDEAAIDRLRDAVTASDPAASLQEDLG
jgi:fermentation-respiration switch protein FrsA (DUF1100 family)